eukprot:6213761-Pleurochrysis_carterae.AAC.3
MPSQQARASRNEDDRLTKTPLPGPPLPLPLPLTPPLPPPPPPPPPPFSLINNSPPVPTFPCRRPHIGIRSRIRSHTRSRTLAHAHSLTHTRARTLAHAHSRTHTRARKLARAHSRTLTRARSLAHAHSRTHTRERTRSRVCVQLIANSSTRTRAHARTNTPARQGAISHKDRATLISPLVFSTRRRLCVCDMFRGAGKLCKDRKCDSSCAEVEASGGQAFVVSGGLFMFTDFHATD